MMDLAKEIAEGLGIPEKARSIAGCLRFLINSDDYSDNDRDSMVKKRAFHKKKKSL
jgi:hypothetical protein